MSKIYGLSLTSQKRLVGVHPGLVAVVYRSIEITTVDFGVTEGIRTVERQRELVAKGASKTMNSMHIVQQDGLSHAVDLVAYMDGRPEWKMPFYFELALAVQKAAEERDFGITWGCVWDRDLRDLRAGDPLSLADDVEEYKMRQKAKGKTAFMDGPHFQVRE